MSKFDGSLTIVFNHFKDGPWHALNLLIFLATLMWFHDNQFEQVILVVSSMGIGFNLQFYKNLSEKLGWYQ